MNEALRAPPLKTHAGCELCISPCSAAHQPSLMTLRFRLQHAPILEARISSMTA